MQKRLALSLILAIFLLSALALPVFAQEEGPGKLVVGGVYTLGSGEVLRGGLVVAGGSATLQSGSTVFGDVLVLGGSLRVAGTVNGDVAVFGGSMQLTGTAVVNGDVVSFGGSVDRQPGAVINGDFRKEGAFSLPALGPLLPFAPGIEMGRLAPEVGLASNPGQWLLVQFLRFLQNIGLTLAFGALALIIALVWPKGVERVGRTEMEQPLLAFAVGLLTWVLALGLAIIMAITICLIPFAMLLGLVLLGVVVLAWVATGWVLGHKLLGLLNMRNPSLVVETVVGTVVLLLAYFLVSLIFCLDFVFGVIVVSLGTGALVLTRFGRQPYVPGGRSAAPQPPAGPPPAALAEPRAVVATPPAVRSASELGLPPEAQALTEPGAVVTTPSAVRSASELGLPPEAQALAEELQSASGISGVLGEPTPAEEDHPAVG